MAALRTAIDRRGVPLREVRAGDRLRGGDGCSLEVLHPPRRGILGSDNANSLVLSVEYRGRRILLPGDLESPGLGRRAGRGAAALRRADGPAPRQPPEQLAGTGRLVPTALGRVQRRRPLELAARGRALIGLGGQVLHTFEGGAIEVRIDATGVKVSEFVGQR